MAKVMLVRELAAEARLDLDEVLVRLWDAGLAQLNGPEDKVPLKAAKLARRTLGVATARDAINPNYWRRQFRMTDEEFGALLISLDINVRPRARRLPKGAAARLRREARRRGLFPEPVPAQPEPARPRRVEWRTIGHEVELHHLSADDVIRIHEGLVEDFAAHSDPIDPPGVKSTSLLESAIGRPHTSLGGERKYPTIELAAAALLHSLTQNHAFHNGNKRTALVALVAFLERHGLLPTCDDQELFRLVLLVAQHSLLDFDAANRADAETLAIAEWLCANTRPVDKSERPLPWRKLRAILTTFGCRLEHANGNRMNVMRTVRRRILLFSRDAVLKIQVFYGDDGRDAEKNTIAAIRKELELDEEHGVDSQLFYNRDPWSPGDFITKYRKILRRLSSL